MHNKRNFLLATLVVLANVIVAPLPCRADLQQSAQNERSPVQNKDLSTPDSDFVAAAEPFELLTEQAFSAPPHQLDQKITVAEKAADRVRGALTAQAASELNSRLADVRSARKSNDRSSLALASIEAYRILVSAARPTRVPTAVSLLDYAGFRYDADLKTKPIRWSDMRVAADFAAQQWNAILNSITDTALKNQFSEALRQMENAVAERSMAKAKTAVKTELDLVDKLQAHFNGN